MAEVEAPKRQGLSGGLLTRPWATPTVAGLATVVLYCIQGVARGEFPFGPLSNQVNDLGTQIVPFMAEYGRILRGASSLSSLEWTWTLGMGVPFLGVYATYLANPLFLIAALFGPDQVELAAAVATIAALGLAATSMCILLRSLVPSGRPWLNVVLATCYGLSGWAVNDANYFPVWLWGLIAFPWLVMAARWTMDGRRFGVGVVIVALAWWGNYYTGFMASVGAGVVLVTMLIAERAAWQRGARAVLTFSLQGLLGIGATGVILIPTIAQVQLSTEQQGAIPVGLTLPRLFSHLLPMTEAVAVAPSFYAGTLTLLLFAALLGQSKRSWRFRLVWTGSITLTILSMGTGWGLWVWNGFDTPNGSLWRSAFVVAGMLVISAAYAGTDLAAVRWWGWLGAAAVVAVICVVTATRPWVRSLHPSAFAFAAASAVLVSLSAMSRNSLMSKVSISALCVLTAMELVFTAAFTLEQRNLILPPAELRSGRDVDSMSQADVLQASDWPTRRVGLSDVGDPNAGAYLGVPTSGYYSSVIPQVTTNALYHRLGATQGTTPRKMYYRPDAVSDALLAVGVHLKSNQLEPVRAFPTVRALPVDRVAMLEAAATTMSLENVFEQRNALFASPVYSFARQTMEVNGVVSTAKPGETVQLAAGDRVTIRTGCSVLRQATFDARRAVGTATLEGSENVMQVSGVPTFPLAQGHTGAVEFTATDISVIPAQPAACLDPVALEEAVSATEVPAIEVGPATTLRATFRSGVDGVAVLAFAPVDGWTCLADGQHTEMRSLSGLAAVPMNGARALTCSYATPRLASGALLTLASLAMVLCIGWWGARRRRVQASGPATGSGRRVNLSGPG